MNFTGASYLACFNESISKRLQTKVSDLETVSVIFLFVYVKHCVQNQSSCLFVVKAFCQYTWPSMLQSHAYCFVFFFMFLIPSAWEFGSRLQLIFPKYFFWKFDLLIDYILRFIFSWKRATLPTAMYTTSSCGTDIAMTHRGEHRFCDYIILTSGYSTERQ